MVKIAFEERIARNLSLPVKAVAAVLRLLNDGASIPFIARYRKEASGGMDEVQLAKIADTKQSLEALVKRREYILSAIEELGQLTPQLRGKLEQCWDANELEDLYLPFKKKRKTRAEQARQKGLEPLANWLWRQEKGDPRSYAKSFLSKDVPSTEAALAGAQDIIAERVSEDQRARNTVRKHYKRSARIVSKAARGKKAEADKYRDYLDFSEGMRRIPSHRLLAILRGQAEGVLSVSIRPTTEEVLYDLGRLFLRNHGSVAKVVKEAIEEGYNRLLAPSIETEVRNAAKAKADQEAIAVFAENLRQLLLAPPLGAKRVLGIDPGFRTGCKVVAIDRDGSLLAHTTIFPHPPQNRTIAAAKTLRAFCEQHQLEVAAIGNGTAGRETLSFCRGVDFGRPVELYSVNEAGASIYSASAIARSEFPDKDVTVRGAVSIARRLQDPLAELVKIDAKNIGVGQYQHDVNQQLLRAELDRTVESCVNSVGIDLNTASQHLLTYVSGLGPGLAENIVNYRSDNGPFHSREELLKVNRLGSKAFEQAAGFLRIRNAKNPLDNTAVHPERYPVVAKMAKDIRTDVAALIESNGLQKQIRLENYQQADLGLPTLKDIMEELAKPGRDPRGAAKSFSFGQVNSMEDLKEGMVLPGIVTNVTAFGAFVDIGIKENGLVHISELANRFVKDPKEVVKLNQQVRVKVLEIDQHRKRVALSMKAVE